MVDAWLTRVNYWRVALCGRPLRRISLVGLVGVWGVCAITFPDLVVCHFKLWNHWLGFPILFPGNGTTYREQRLAETWKRPKRSQFLFHLHPAPIKTKWNTCRNVSCLCCNDPRKKMSWKEKVSGPNGTFTSAGLSFDTLQILADSINIRFVRWIEKLCAPLTWQCARMVLVVGQVNHNLYLVLWTWKHFCWMVVETFVKSVPASQTSYKTEVSIADGMTWCWSVKFHYVPSCVVENTKKEIGNFLGHKALWHRIQTISKITPPKKSSDPSSVTRATQKIKQIKFCSLHYLQTKPRCLQVIFWPLVPVHRSNKKQCSRQLQCEVPCSVGHVVNSSLSSLSSTSHALHRGGGLARGVGHGGFGWGRGLGRGRGVKGRGQETFHPPCHMVLHPKGTSHNYMKTRSAGKTSLGRGNYWKSLRFSSAGPSFSGPVWV